MRVMLYFNLPYEDIVKEEIKPVRIYYCDIKLAELNRDQNPINEMLNKFETDNQGKRLANLIILKIPSNEKDS